MRRKQRAGEDPCVSAEVGKPRHVHQNSRSRRSGMDSD